LLPVPGGHAACLGLGSSGGGEVKNTILSSAEILSCRFSQPRSNQPDYAKSAYETFVAESKKISELYTDFAKQTFKPFEGLIAKMTPAK
jgi:hypothetical protein